MDVCLISDFYLHLLKLPLDFFTKRKTGEILSRINEANVIRNAISSTLLSIAMDSVMIILGAFFMVKMGSVLLLVSVIPVLFSTVIVYLLKNPFNALIKDQAIIEAEKNASMYEAINGIATIKGLATEDKAFYRSERRIVEAAYKNLKLRKLGNLQNGGWLPVEKGKKDSDYNAQEELYRKYKNRDEARLRILRSSLK